MVFGFGKRRKEAAKQQALEIGSALVDRINATLTHWRENDLEARRTMTENFFLERLVSLEPTEELSFEMMTEIEALALTKNWVEGADQYAAEFMNMLSEDDIECIGVLGIEDEVKRHVLRNIQEVSDLLDEDVNRAIVEAVERRGETPTPR